MQDCYNALLAGGLSARTVQQAHMVLHKALADAMRMDLVVRNATEGTSVPRPDRKEMETLSFGQLWQLFEATRSDRFAALWVLLGTSGHRVARPQPRVLHRLWHATGARPHPFELRPGAEEGRIPRIRPHDVRHTAATLILQEGLHPKVVQEMLGHSSISVTLDIYSHVAPTLHREAADRMVRS